MIVTRFLSLSAAIAFTCNAATPTLAFQSTVQSQAPACSFHDRIQSYRRPSTFFMSESSETPAPESSESEAEQAPVSPPSTPPPSAPVKRKPLDPLVASLTRVDEPTPQNVPKVNAPLLGEIPADGNLALLAPAAGIAVLGFIFSIVVAFNSKDALVSELSAIEIPKMEYKETVVEEGVCRGLCANQEKDLEGLRGFMESLGK